jgi:hypothetical protein
MTCTGASERKHEEDDFEGQAVAEPSTPIHVTHPEESVMLGGRQLPDGDSSRTAC